jgi:hypothetical protein
MAKIKVSLQTSVIWEDPRTVYNASWECDIPVPEKNVPWYWPIIITPDWVAIPANVTGGKLLAYPAKNTNFHIEIFDDTE